jgi:hypothetical protein
MTCADAAALALFLTVATAIGLAFVLGLREVARHLDKL